MNGPPPAAGAHRAGAGSRQRIVDRLRAAGCVFAEDEADLLITEVTDRGLGEADLDRFVARRADGEPLELVVGWASVAGRRVAVGPGVFVPRRRSELLVAEATARLAGCTDDAPDRARVVVDVGCGTGALGLCVVSPFPSVVLHASDIDPVAVDLARRNIAGRGTVHRGDLFEALPSELRGSVDLVLANLPYVPESARDLLPSEARRHEPRHSLDGGADGLDHVRRMLAEVPGWLRPGGVVLAEHAADQTGAVLAAATASALDARTVSDERSSATVLVAVRPPTAADRVRSP